MQILNQRAICGVKNSVSGTFSKYIMTTSKYIKSFKPRATSGLGEAFDGVEGLGFLNATSPNKLTAALTDEKGAAVSISPTSALGESKEKERPFTPMLLF